MNILTKIGFKLTEQEKDFLQNLSITLQDTCERSLCCGEGCPISHICQDDLNIIDIIEEFIKP